MHWLWTFLGLVTVAALALFGTVRALPKYNIPAQYRLSVIGAKAGSCLVRVIGSDTNEFPIVESGEVTIDVPRLPRSCSWVWFGLTISDGSPSNLRAIHILRDGRVVRRLSLHQIERLPFDTAGARQIRL